MGKEKNKTTLSEDDIMIVYLKNPRKKTMTKLTQIMKEFSNMAGYKINI